MTNLLCRLGLHKWTRRSLDYGRYVERRCDRFCGVPNQRIAWHERQGRHWVPKPVIRCTHGVNGGPILFCPACANETPAVWR